MTGQHRWSNVMIGQYRFYNFGLGFNPVKDEGSTAYWASPSQGEKCSKKNQNAPRLLSIPQSVRKNVKTFRWDQRLLLNSIQYLLFRTIQGKETNFRVYKLIQNKVQK